MNQSAIDDSVKTETYGLLRINLFRFKNVQLRTGISILSEKPITKENSTGAIVSPMLSKDCRVKKLHSLEYVRDSMKKIKPYTMNFLELNGKQTTIVM